MSTCIHFWHHAFPPFLCTFVCSQAAQIVVKGIRRYIIFIASCLFYKGHHHPFLFSLLLQWGRCEAVGGSLTHTQRRLLSKKDSFSLDDVGVVRSFGALLCCSSKRLTAHITSSSSRQGEKILFIRINYRMHSGAYSKNIGLSILCRIITA